MVSSRFLLTSRRITQFSFILLVVLMPVLNIFRYDTATHELIVFGKIWSLGLKAGFYADPSLSVSLHVALHFLLNAILPWIIILSIFPLAGFIGGRFFCGWFCPEGALFEWADYLTLKVAGRRSLYKRRPSDPETSGDNRIAFIVLAALSAVVIPLLAGVALTGYFVAPKTVWTQIAAWRFTFGVKAGIIGVAVYILIGSIFVRHVFCKFVCAPGLMQMLLGWISPLSLRIKMDTARIAECTDCRNCEKACFMNVLPRKNKRDISCVGCGACVAACHKELGEGKGLFRYQMGEAREKHRERNAADNTGLYDLRHNTPEP
ncbi:MAG: 4Fe-4S binding protein [Nitrospirae bacterium]|nr:4Fe-4S binding protein [Nitrospirota bacterium]